MRLPRHRAWRAIGGTIGTVAGAFGGRCAGTVLGTAGELMDLSRYASNLQHAGIPFSPNYGQAFATGITGLPFGLGSFAGVFGARDPREQSEGARRAALSGEFGNLAHSVFGNVSPSMEPTWAAATDPMGRNPGIFGPRDEYADMVNSYPEIFAMPYTLTDAAPPAAAAAAAFDPASLGRDYGYGGPNGAMGAPAGGTGYASGVYGSGVGADADNGGIGGNASGRGGDATDTTGNGGGDTGRGDSFGWAKGGKIEGGAKGRARGLLDVDPPGVDDAYAPVQTGEDILSRRAMRRYPGLLDALNSGNTRKAIGLLGAIR